MPRYCARCILPDTRPGVVLDDEGVCAGCRNAEAKRGVDWSERERTFDELVRRARGAGAQHDCVVPVSGGKDSFWQVVTCLEHGLRPLCVTYVTPGRTALGERNLERLRGLGVDHVELRVDPDLERSFVRKAFERTGISGLVTHMAIYAWPLQVALTQGIPLVVYGENSAFEYGSRDAGLDGHRVDARWRAAFGVTDGTTAADWVDNELTEARLWPYFVPPDDAIQRAGLEVVFLGWYFAWDPERSLAVAQRHGFEARAEGPRVGHYDYVNIDDDMLGVHHHPKWHKFGITRTWDTLSMEIRAGRLTRDAAIEALRTRGDETPWPDIDAFCNYVGMREDEYFAVLERFRNPGIWTDRDGVWTIEGFLVPEFDWAAVGRRRVEAPSP